MAFGGLVLIVLITVLYTFYCLVRVAKRRRTVGFFHPYCNAGGGGERVLWTAINAMRKYEKSSRFHFIVFTGDTEETEAILAKAEERFNLKVSSENLEFVYLWTRPLLEARLYPRFTLLLQMLASLVVGMEALIKVNPEIFIDTMGYPLTLPLFRFLGGAKVGCYVHYPVISSDMIGRVQNREAAFNNVGWVAQSQILSQIKCIYYCFLAFCYRLCGIASRIVMVNGTWTRNHILQLWKIPERTRLVYPPCDVLFFQQLSSKEKAECALKKKAVQILTVGQIRPEKNHKTQVEIFAALKKRAKVTDKKYKFHFVICGGCRDKEDKKRAEELKSYANSLGLKDDLEWALNASVEKLSSLMEESLICIHTMHHEHFGISLVEALSAGLITIAHDSAGPKWDILDGPNKLFPGLLASTLDDYVQCVDRVLCATPETREIIRSVGKSVALQFTPETFEREWNDAVESLFD